MRPPLAAALLLVFAAPIIWGVRFLLVYGVTGLYCARPMCQLTWLGLPLVSWLISAATVAALGAIAWVHLKLRRRSEQALPFLSWLGRMLALLAALAIIWETLPAFLVPYCQ